MSRGAPALWSGVLSIPFLLGAGWLYWGQSTYPPIVALPFLCFGLFVFLVGCYVHVLGAPDAVSPDDDEEVLDKRNPTQRVALVKILIGLPLLGVMWFLLFFTRVPYVYPTIAFVLGLYYFSTGIHIYWTNTLTTYYITSERVVKVYRFVSLVRQEIPQQKIRSVQERRSIIESLVGLGNVRVSSGEGRSLEIRMNNVTQPRQFAETVRTIV